MKHLLTVLLLAVLASSWSGSALTLSDSGTTSSVIVVDQDATGVELRAAQELSTSLERVTGARFPLVQYPADPPSQCIVVGRGRQAERFASKQELDSLGDEEILIRTSGSRLLLSGGRPRGTQYAVYHFLQRYCGVRWWTPWASHYPQRRDLTLGSIDVRYQPTFESRDPFWHVAFDPDWAARNFSNSQSARLRPDQGGAIVYKGFVHTFYPLVPPEKHFAQHPEWYSEIDGKRTSDHAQLCLSNPELRAFVVKQVKAWLREAPEARIISVSQNDWHKPCACQECKATDDAEGSHAGSLLVFVNHVAASIAAEFPQVAVDTLAYQYTRKPPKNVKPLPNVIVRLCSIECNFREPLDHSSNAAFADDIRGWAKICNRLYIWDYTTDFAHYVQPHPNWFVLGANVRFFARHSVRGLFEQGAYQSPGSEMAELRSWVLAQLLWNPDRDDASLIREFLDGYYGAAAPLIAQYLELFHRASQGYNLTCFSSTDTPFHRLEPLRQAETLWEQAEKAVADNMELVRRVRMARLPLHYVWLARWNPLLKEWKEKGGAWPVPSSRKQLAEQWLTVATGAQEAPWSQVSLVNESGLTPKAFVEKILKEPSPDAVSETRAVDSKRTMPRVQVATNSQTLVTSDGMAFFPFGVNYFRPHTGWAPQVWKRFDAEAVRQDFARMKELGVNCVRVFLTFGSFLQQEGEISPEGLKRFDQFLDLAEEAGIYVHPTGPDHWEGLPDWAKNDRIADERVLQALETFWKAFALRYRDRNVLFAYDLLNEPEVGWNTPAMKPKWNEWVTRKYGSLDKALERWGKHSQTGSSQETPVPAASDAVLDPHLLDYQLFREDLATDWTRRQVQAIKSVAPQALVTVGLIQWSVPALLPGVKHYSGFRPANLAPFLDFMEVHFYPLENGFYTYRPEDGVRNLAYLESVVRNVAACGKPVILAEFGWYGGGKLTLENGKHPPASEEQQATWCRQAVESTAGYAVGWLNWGLYDHPEAGDVTQLTGLLSAKGAQKEWGREFSKLAQRLPTLAGHRPIQPRPALDWNRCITSTAEGNAFRQEYAKSVQGSAKP